MLGVFENLTYFKGFLLSCVIAFIAWLITFYFAAIGIRLFPSDFLFSTTGLFTYFLISFAGVAAMLFSYRGEGKE